MKQVDAIAGKIMNLKQLESWVAAQRVKGRSVAFTNGCFDIIHAGHITSLQAAAKEADILIVALNSDSSVRKLKGPRRPVNSENDRAGVMASFVYCDAVIIFEEETPLNIIQAILPDKLVKGGDYTVEQIAGAAEVIAAGGTVVIHPVVSGYSTTSTIEKVRQV